MLGGSNQAILDTTIVTDVIVAVTQDVDCYGDSTGIVSVINPQTGMSYSYTWLDLNGDTVGVASIAGNLPAGDYILHAGYTDAGCTTLDTVRVSQSPLIHSSGIVMNVSCNGGSDGSIVSTTSGGTGIGTYVYSWNTTPVNTTSSISSLTSGVYELTVTDNNSCSITQTYTVTEPAPLVATVSASQTYILNASVVGGIPPYSYSWVEQTQPSVELGILASYTVGANGIYYVVVTDANDCESTSNSTTFSEPTGTLDLISSIDLRVYPNPFREETTVDFGQTISNATIRIVDVYGKLIELHELTNTDKYIIQRANKARGVYFLEIETSKQYLKTIKLVIE